MKDTVYVEVCKGKKMLSSWSFDLPSEFFFCKENMKDIINHRCFLKFIDNIVHNIKLEEDKFNKIYIVFLNNDNEIICEFLAEHFWFGKYRLKFFDIKGLGYKFKMVESE